MGNLSLLTYMGFMRGRFTKALFLIYCAAMVEPNEKISGVHNTQWAYDLYNVMSYVCLIAAVGQLLKFFNKNQ